MAHERAPLVSSVREDVNRRSRCDAQTRRLFLGVCMLTLAVYLISVRGIPTTFDERIVADTTSALSHGRADVHTPLLGEFPNLAVTRADGAKVGIYGIGTSAVGAPLYVAGAAIAAFSPPSKHTNIVVNATMFTNAFVSATTVFVLMLVCMLLGATRWGAVVVGLSFGLASYAYPHAITLFTEPGTALCVIGAVLFSLRASDGSSQIDLLSAGALAATALLFRVSAALFLPLFGLYLFAVGLRSSGFVRGLRNGITYVLGAAGPLLLLLLVNWWRYHSPVNFGYGLEKATGQKYAIWRGLAGQWLSSGKSLFIYAPFAVLAVVAFVRYLRRIPLEMCLLGTIVLANTLFFARVQFWSGDWAWGPRYMQIVLPCLAAMVAPLMNARVWRGVLVGLSAVGFFFAALPAVLLRFTILFQSAYQADPPPTVHGPKNWDHSYYALVWHTWRWQPIRYQLAQLPHVFMNTIGLGKPAVARALVDHHPESARFEFWWLRLHDIGGLAYTVFLLAVVTSALFGIRLLLTYRRIAAQGSTSKRESTVNRVED
jgi:hypothetical protein